MRYDKTVYFQTMETTYDKETGDYSETVTEVARQASINQTGVETINMVYQKIPEESLTVRLQNKYSADFDFIRIGEKRYRVDKRIDLYVKQCFIVSEVH